MLLVAQKVTTRSVSRVVRVARRGFSNYQIHPAIGIARLGNAKGPSSWYVAPTEIGGLPQEHEEHTDSGRSGPVQKFKTADGKIRRQAAKFTVFKDDAELKFDDNVEWVKWTVWVANKKAVWWNFSELCGDLMLGPDNSYKHWSHVMKHGADGDAPGEKATPVTSLRNQDVQNPANRQKYVINPGPREVGTDGPHFATFDNDPNVYPNASFPNDALPQDVKMAGTLIESLGDMNMSFNEGDSVSLFVRGGYGHTCGNDASKFGGFAGADGWFDDTSDGPVECEIKLKDQDEPIRLKAYVVCASPKVAPELVNITTWDDVIFDMAVRYLDFGTKCGMVDAEKRYILGEDGYKPSIQNDILPLFRRMRDIQWVANISAMTQFATPPFPIDNENPPPAELAARKKWFSMLREAVDLSGPIDHDLVTADSHQQLFTGGNLVEVDTESYPAMPLQAGSGSVNGTSASGPMSKFTTFTPTQFYMLYQWALGHTGSGSTFNLNPLDRAAVGNCVGYPSSPGIEVTWTTRNPRIYDPEDFYRLRSVDIEQLKVDGLSLERDETEGGSCEPGDMSKRMAIPWTADFSYCSVQGINFTDPSVNQGGESTLPQYYAYWWPAQSPFNVYIGNLTKEQQILEQRAHEAVYAGISGQNVLYQRGLADIQDPNELIRTMITHWSDLGFIVNTNKSDSGADYPYFVEKERNFEQWAELYEQKRVRKNKLLLEIAKQAEALEKLQTAYVNI